MESAGWDRFEETQNLFNDILSLAQGPIMYFDLCQAPKTINLLLIKPNHNQPGGGFYESPIPKTDQGVEPLKPYYGSWWRRRFWKGGEKGLSGGAGGQGEENLPDVRKE